MRLVVKGGEIFGNLTIINEVLPDILPCGQKYRKVECSCSCGRLATVSLHHLRKGSIKSCGCLQGEQHGFANHKLYRVWHAMRQRCSKEYSHAVKNYKHRGITVCDDWENSFIKFKDWAFANGWKPGLQVDRINVDGNYEPSNCRLVTNKENNRNRRDTKKIIYEGELIAIGTLLERLNVPYNANAYCMITRRILRGWSVQDAIATPCLDPNAKSLHFKNSPYMIKRLAK